METMSGTEGNSQVGSGPTSSGVATGDESTNNIQNSNQTTTNTDTLLNVQNWDSSFRAPNQPPQVVNQEFIASLGAELARLRLRGGADAANVSANSNGSGGDGDGNPATHTGSSGSTDHLGGGRGGGPSSDMSTLQTASAVILKMFRDPVPNPVPASSKLLPAGTEIFRAKIESRQDKYSPVMWADSQIPFQVKVNTMQTAIDVATAVGVDVNNTFDTDIPELSELGKTIAEILNRGLDDPSVRAFEVKRGRRDMSAISMLMSMMSDMGAVCIRDQAPMIRLGLMAMTFAPTQWVAYTTSCIQNMCCNGFVKLKDTTMSISEAPTSEDGQQPGTKENTTVLWWRTLGQYARILSNTADNREALGYVRDKDKEKYFVCPTTVKFVPVKSAWRGFPWLMAYVIAHTSTIWWNHAVTYTHKVTIHDQKDEKSNKMEIVTIPKASTVYVPGNTMYICLVIVDNDEGSTVLSRDYLLTSGASAYAAKFEGNKNFAENIQQYLGRSSGGVKYDPSDFAEAWRRMCEETIRLDDPMSVQVMLSVLCTSRFNGFAVWPDPDKPKTEIEYSRWYAEQNELDLERYPDDTQDAVDMYNHLRVAKPTKSTESSIWLQAVMAELGGVYEKTDTDHIAGATCADPKTDIIIGDHTIPDWFTSYATTAVAPDRVKFYSNWRVDPLHNFSLGLVDIKDGKKPYLHKYKAGQNQYQVKEASDLFRILVYAGAYASNPACDRNAVESIEILLNRIVGYGSLMLALTEWWRLSAGMSIMDKNRIGKCRTHINPEMWEIMSNMTNKFALEPPSRGPCLWHGYDAMDTVDLVKTQLAMTDADWLECWYGGVVPWWYVKAVFEKFGYSHVVRCKPKQEYDVGLTDYDNMIGYFIKMDNSNALDLAALSSAVRYEIKVKNSYYPWFTIYTPNANARQQGVHWTSWYYNFINDNVKSGTRGQTLVPIPDWKMGVVELNAIAFPSCRVHKGYGQPQSFIIDQTRWLSDADYSMIGGLMWPDPFMDWLKQGAIKVLPHLMRADIVGAAGEGLAHINKTILDWLSNKIHGDGGSDSFRE